MIDCAPNKYPVALTPEERQRLEDIARNGHAPVKKVRHSQVLLLADHNRPDGPWTEPQIAAALAMHRTPSRAAASASSWRASGPPWSASRA
jgi:hypothetical protein